MNRNTVFSQIMQLICQYRFKKCVDQYERDKYTKRFSCWQQLIVLLFAQVKSLTSLQDNYSKTATAIFAIEILTGQLWKFPLKIRGKAQKTNEKCILNRPI